MVDKSNYLKINLFSQRGIIFKIPKNTDIYHPLQETTSPL